MDLKKMSDGSAIHKYEYGYDANGNRTRMEVTQVGHDDERDYLYGYDRLNRLTYAERGDLNVAGNAVALGGKGRAWGLDVLGNWSGDLDAVASGNQSVIDYTTQSIDPLESGYTQGTDGLDAFTHHDTDESNAITQHSFDDDGDGPNVPTDTDFFHDAAGNLVLDDTNFYKYDAWNRIVAVHNKDTLSVDVSGDLTGSPAANPFVTYDYDALGRRIAKSVDTNSTEYFYYDGHRVIEHHKDNGPGSTTLLKQYVYGLNYIDEPVAYYDADASGVPVTTPHFILRDANYDVVGITDDQGTLVQQMTLDPYGNYLHIEDENGVTYNNVDADVAMLETPFGRNALWYDPETGLYYNRARYYDPVLGRWRQRDPRGTALVCGCGLSHSGRPVKVKGTLISGAQFQDGMGLYQYVGNSPAKSTDPTGLAAYPVCGPDVTTWFADELNLHARFFRTFRPALGSRPSHFKRYAAQIPYNRTIFRVGDCPSGDRCKNTVTLCNTCIHKSELGNIMFGYIGKIFLHGERLIIGAGARLGTVGLNTPEDMAGAVAGIGLAKAGVSLDYPDFDSSTLCTEVRANQARLVAGLSAMNIGRTAPALLKQLSGNLIGDMGQNFTDCNLCPDAPVNLPHSNFAWIKSIGDSGRGNWRKTFSDLPVNWR